jgi:hypothetical protein
LHFCVQIKELSRGPRSTTTKAKKNFNSISRSVLGTPRRPYFWSSIGVSCFEGIDIAPAAHRSFEAIRLNLLPGWRIPHAMDMKDTWVQKLRSPPAAPVLHDRMLTRDCRYPRRRHRVIVVTRARTTIAAISRSTITPFTTAIHTSGFAWSAYLDTAALSQCFNLVTYGN